MLSKRKSQKPGDELIRDFRNNFPDLVSKGNADMEMKGHDQNLDTECMSGILPDYNFSLPCVNPEALSLTSDVNQHQYYSYLNSSKMGTVLHSQAGDLHTPMGSKLTTSPPQNPMVAASENFYTRPGHFDLLDSYQTPSESSCSQQASASSQSLRLDSGYVTMDESSEGSPVNNVSVQTDSKPDLASPESHRMDMASDGEKLRYDVSLRAPTAMFDHATEDPVTYLNKGQDYSLRIKDSNPPSVGSDMIRYRTCVRVSFEDKGQRLEPAAYWQLWNDSRAMNEAHSKKIPAVEYLDAHPHSDTDETHLEEASFDGFSFTWSAYPNTCASDCDVGVRFNFLSTDFSHSKGVKGASVRLCVKTEILSPESAVDHEPEVCFCKVKLFRDHGAERKLCNDVAQANRTIEKLKNQVLQVEIRPPGRRRLDGGTTTFQKRGNRPAKIAKRPSKYSSSRQGSPERRLKDDLHTEIDTVQRMFSSARLVSNLDLRGDEDDDPDLHPVQLKGDPKGWSTNDLYPESVAADSTRPQLENSAASAHGSKQSVHPAVDRQAPVKNSARPVACFYVRFVGNGKHVDDYYHAIYLTERTVRDLMGKISEKQMIDRKELAGVFHLNRNGLRILVDDDVVRELPEGQDMIVEVSEASSIVENAECMDVHAKEVKLIY